MNFEHNGQLLPSISVGAYDADGNLVTSSNTMYDGLYELSKLSAGTYFLATRTSNIAYQNELFQQIPCPGGPPAGCNPTDGTTTSEHCRAEQKSPSSLPGRVVEALRDAGRPLTRTALRSCLRVNNQRLGEALQDLEQTGQILRDRSGWRLSAFCSLPLGVERNGTVNPAST